MGHTWRHQTNHVLRVQKTASRCSCVCVCISWITLWRKQIARVVRVHSVDHVATLSRDFTWCMRACERTHVRQPSKLKGHLHEGLYRVSCKGKIDRAWHRQAQCKKQGMTHRDSCRKRHARIMVDAHVSKKNEWITSFFRWPSTRSHHLGGHQKTFPKNLFETKNCLKK